MNKIFFLILTPKNQKFISLFEFLINEERWYRIVDISTHIDLSIRSTQRYINELFDKISCYNDLFNDNIELLITKNSGVKLLLNTGIASFWGFIRYIVMNDNAFEVARSIFFSQFDNPIAFATSRNLSLTTVHAFLKKCNEFCIHSGLSTLSDKHEVTGDEKVIRITTYSITWFLNHGLFWPKTHTEIDEIKLSNILDQLCLKNELEIIPLKRRKLSYFIATNLLRIRKKKYIPMQTEWISFFKNDQSGIIAMVESLYKEYHVYNQAEIYFLAVYWQSETTLYKNYDSKADVIMIHKNNNTCIYQITTLFCELFSSKIIAIPKSMQSEIFKQAFFTHLNCSISKINDYFNYDTIFLSDSSQYPFLTAKLSELLDDLYSITKNTVFCNREVLTRTYILMYSYVKSLPEYEPEIYIYLETDLPYTEEVHIKHYIHDYFHTSFNLKFIDNQFPLKTDLILTSIPLDTDVDYCLVKLLANMKNPIANRSMKHLENRLVRINQVKTSENS